MVTLPPFACRRRAASAALAIVLLGVAAAAATASAGGTAAGATDQARGAPIYARYCAICHGDRGEGYAADYANALANPDFLASVDDEFLHRAIANGRPGTAMAAHAERYGGPLAAADIEALVDLIRSWQSLPRVKISAEPVLGDPVAGREVYDASCAACHGDRGQGVTAVSLDNPEFLASASDGQIRRAIAHGRRGTPMTAYRELLSADQIDDLVALIRSWQRDLPNRHEMPDFDEFPPVVINPDGPPPDFTLRDGRYLPAAQLDAALRQGARLVILDARPPSDWVLARIPGAVPAPAYDPDSIIIRLPEDGTWIVSYCACPHKYSDMLTDALRGAGFANTAVLDEGVRWWQHEGYPIEYGP